GVLAPCRWSEAGGGEPWWQETQCLVAPSADDRARSIRARVRFLQLRRRAASAAAPLPWDEGDTREIDFEVPLEDSARTREIPFAFAGGRDELAGDVWHRAAVEGRVVARLERADADRPLCALSVQIENLGPEPAPGASREEALVSSLVATHLMLAASGAEFVSLMDPPAWARDAAARCRNTRTYPVLAGPAPRRDLILSAPVILSDHAGVAPESPRDLFDATEIDEILTLRILTLTDDEKREARATDARVAALIDHVDRLGPEGLARLHGTIRERRPAPEDPRPTTLVVAGVRLTAGSRVLLRPGARRTDAQDMFLGGMSATVREVLRDSEDRDCLAVTVDDDPAADLLSAHGRYHYFYPDEVQPLEVAP
ncbi:MAG TPA: hypothetical protein VHK47_19490, partial [Polyangia bacterium]|nr:hypothetical protein [Polyangia bacterium]